MRLTFACVARSFSIAFIFHSANVAAAPSQLSQTEIRYESAKAVREIASSLQSKTIPADIKAALLDFSRSEDKDYAQKQIVGWRPYLDTEAFAEFDELVIRDADGFEILRMKPNSSWNQAVPTFEINGRSWTVPPTGSVLKSLREHLAETHASAQNPRLLRMLITEVFAGGKEGSQVAAPEAPAFVFAAKLMSVSEVVQHNSPSRHLADENPILETLKSYTPLNWDVACQGGNASGTIKIAHDRMQFDSRSDGTLVLTMSDAAKTRLLVTARKIDQTQFAADALKLLNRKPRTEAMAREIFQTFFRMERLAPNDKAYKDLFEVFNEAMRTKISITRRYANTVDANEKLLRTFYESRKKTFITDEIVAGKCATPQCRPAEVVTVNKTILPWMKSDDQDHILAVDKWIGKNSGRTGATILRTETFDHPLYTLKAKPLTPMNVVAEGERVAREATRAAKRRSTEVRSVMLSLLPLGACCTEAKCRNQVEKQGVNLNEDKSRATGK